VRSELARSPLARSPLARSPLERFDPLSLLDDDFQGLPSDPLLRGWQLFNAGVVSVATVTGGELVLAPTAGGPAGSFWFDTFIGLLLYKEITGPFQAYARTWVLNAAGTGGPPLTDFRMGGIAAHDGVRPPNNYLHQCEGSANLADYQTEPKTTDDSLSTYGFTPTLVLTLDLCIRRYASDLQRFDLRVRPTGLQPLLSNVGWVTTTPISRSNPAIPPRPLAVPLPATLQVGYVCYSNLPAADLQIRSTQWAVRYFGG
jgi:hypothetical protein